jgi:EAL and modified HD-GYP domain-containing signal transduction protein
VTNEAAVATETSANDIFITRQPIYDKNMQAVAYELFFQSFVEDDRQIDYDDATTEVLVNSLIEIGLPNIAETKPAFISISPKYVRGDLPIPLGQQHVVLQIQQRFTEEDNAYTALETLTEKDGYPLALEDFVFTEGDLKLAKLADFIKIDISRLSQEEIEQQLSLLKPLDVKLVAEKIATQADFKRCQNYGFDYFQGYFFCEPNVIKGHRTPTSRLAVLHLLAELQNPEVSFERLEDLITKDVSLSYRILRYINSAQYNLQRKVDSIHQAITLLGLRTIKTWITIIAQSKFDDKPYELMITSLIRARLCELLADAMGESNESLFVVGLFSTLDALLDKPMDEVLQELPLTDEVNDAILNHQGPMGQILHSVIAYEQGDWEQISDLGLDNQSLKNAYLEAIQWTRDVGREILAEP